MHDLELGYLTAEALRPQRKTFPVRKYSELCVFGVSVVNTLSQ
jgi:hypothetical protein